MLAFLAAILSLPSEVIFISALNLIVDSYLSKASSAFAANTMFRSVALHAPSVIRLKADAGPA